MERLGNSHARALAASEKNLAGDLVMGFGFLGFAEVIVVSAEEEVERFVEVVLEKIVEEAI